MKAILRRLKKRNSGGFTLVEVIVSCALLAVLLGGMMLFIYPVIRTFDDTEKVYTADNVANCIDEYITKKISVFECFYKKQDKSLFKMIIHAIISNRKDKKLVD